MHTMGTSHMAIWETTLGVAFCAGGIVVPPAIAHCTGSPDKCPWSCWGRPACYIILYSELDHDILKRHGLKVNIVK